MTVPERRSIAMLATWRTSGALLAQRVPDERHHPEVEQQRDRVDRAKSSVLAPQPGAGPVREGPVAVPEERDGHRDQRRPGTWPSRHRAPSVGVEQLEQHDVDARRQIAPTTPKALSSLSSRRQRCVRRSASGRPRAGLHRVPTVGWPAAAPHGGTASLAPPWLPPSIRRTGLPVVAMVGGGQLSRMTHQAAIALGQSLRVLAADPAESAALVAADVQIGDHRDLAALQRARRRRHRRHLRPRARADRAPARPGGRPATASRPGRPRWCTPRTSWSCAGRSPAAGEPQPAWAEASTVHEVTAFADDVGWPVVLKTPRGGYDGKGVFVVHGPDEVGRPARAARHPAGRGAGRHGARAVRPGRPLAVRAGRRLAGRGDRAARRRLRRGAGAGARAERGARRRGAGARGPDRRPARRGRDARRRAVRDRRRRAGQRAGHAAAQLRALDHRGRPHQPVRAAPARRPRLPAGRHRDDRAGRGDGQRARRRGGRAGLGRSARWTSASTTSWRTGRT